MDRLGRTAAYALSRGEAYLIVGLAFGAVLVAIVGRWPLWVVPAALAAGVLALLLLILDTLLDPVAQRAITLADLEPGRIHDPALRARLLRALEYVRASQKLVRSGPGSSLDAAAGELTQMEQAARSIFEMSLRLQEYRADRLLKRDLEDLQLQQRRGVRLEQDQEEQLATLKQMDDLVVSAERAIDGAVADLGRSYAELQAIKATPELRGRAADALQQLDASSKRLSELAAGYDEAYGARAGRASRGVKP